MRYPNWFTLLLVFALLAIGILSVHAAYPPDPMTDTKWPSSDEKAVSDVQAWFNLARANENTQIGGTVPPLVMPTQSEWDAMSDNEKALWLINRERLDRGVPRLHGLESNVMGVAQEYADYLMANDDTFNHSADGHDPWYRLDANPAIGACHDNLNVAENLAIFWGSGSGWTLPIERAVFNWMYDDNGSGWGHRHAILWYPYNENGGPADREGFLGIGHAFGPHSGYQSSDIVVMNVFDPCAAWDYTPIEGKQSVLVPVLQLLLGE